MEEREGGIWVTLSPVTAKVESDNYAYHEACGERVRTGVWACSECLIQIWLKCVSHAGCRQSV